LSSGVSEKAFRQSIEYARQTENPVIALEDLSYICEYLDYGKIMNRRLHAVTIVHVLVTS